MPVPQADGSLDGGEIKAPRLIEGKAVLPRSFVVERPAVIGAQYVPVARCEIASALPAVRGILPGPISPLLQPPVGRTSLSESNR